jgi:hypothetical protein
MVLTILPARRGTDCAFTLFEIAISLALLSVAVTSMLLLFPTGVKTQQLARFQLYAAVKAEEMVESFAASHNANPCIDTEAFQPWDVPSGYHAFVSDLEAKIASARFGIMPVPTLVARRLDSPGDEIQRILDEGGYLYYSQAIATSQLEEQFVLETLEAPPTETQKLVFTVSGDAQQNAMFVFPWKAWPYHNPYPSPPMHGLHWGNAGDQFEAANALDFPFPGNQYRNHTFEGAAPKAAMANAALEGIDPDIMLVMEVKDAANVRYGFLQYAYNPPGDWSNDTPTWEGCVRYVQAAVRYFKAKFPGKPGLWTAPDPNQFPADGSFWESWPQAERWKLVDAYRFLSHAATCLTRWKDKAALTTGVDIPSVTLAAVDTGAVTITHDMILAYHECCLRTAMTFAARYPYDWGVPRPTQRSIMMDCALLQWDLFPTTSYPALSGTLFDGSETGGSVAASQWRPVPSQPIRNLGVSFSFPDRMIGPEKYANPTGPQIWGDAEHFTIAAPFTAAERCRELVFWAVDWQAYEDAEIAPSAPVDASKWNIAAPINGQSFASRMGWNQWPNHHLYDSRNPERNQAFKSDVSGRASGAPITDALVDHVGEEDKWDAAIFLGLHGADRNFNGRLDRGPVPRSTRLRAVEVGRFLYYDPRVPAVIR